MERPLGSNCGERDQRLATADRNAVAAPSWCGVFVHEAFLHAGIDLPSWIASVPETYNQARAGPGGLKPVPEETRSSEATS